MKMVSIIIAAYHREKELFQLIKSLNKLNYSKKKLVIYIVIDGFKILKKSLELLEKQIFPISRTLCEPFLTKKKIYPTFSKKNSVNNKLKLYLDILTYSDGKNSLFEISKKLNKSEAKIKKAIFKLKKMNLLQIQ